jgi:hypothetical protein
LSDIYANTEIHEITINSDRIHQWRDVVGYEGLYQVSSHGQVKSLARKVRNGDGITRSLPEIVLSPHSPDNALSFGTTCAIQI